MYQSAVNDNAEDFHKVAVDAFPTVVIGVKFMWIGVISPWFHILGKK
jgi:hypothetical protein